MCQIQETSSLGSAPSESCRVVFKEAFETLNNDSAAHDLYALDFTDVGPDLGDSRSPFEEVLGENLSQPSNVDEEGIKLDSSGRPESIRPAVDPLAAAPKLQSLDIAVDDEDEEYTPKQFMADRKTCEGLQLLVQWADYPEEQDWTWEPESAMMDCAPDIVAAWKVQSEVALGKEDLVTVDYIVEKILGRRKFKGVPHYLVKWKGFEETKDRTWEPCERLRIDVPLIVEEFEEKKMRK